MKPGGDAPGVGKGTSPQLKGMKPADGTAGKNAGASGSGMLEYVNSLKKGGKPADEIAKLLA